MLYFITYFSVNIVIFILIKFVLDKDEDYLEMVPTNLRNLLAMLSLFIGVFLSYHILGIVYRIIKAKLYER